MATITRRGATIALAGLCSTAPVPLFSRHAFAGDSRLPGKSQRIIVPFAAGGIADGLGRVVAEILNGSLETRFGVDNRSGRNGTVGAEMAARAPPNGQTLLLGTLGTAITNHYLYKHLEYDSEASFAPVALVAEVANVLLVHPTFPAYTLAEFVDTCKRRGPHRVPYSSPGAGGTGHLFMEYFQSQAGIRLTHIDYGGRSRMIRALLAGQVLVAMDNLPSYLTHIRSGVLRALGVSSAKRCDCAPDVASIAEQGYPGYEATLWWYVAAPAGTRLALVKKLSKEITKGIATEAAVRRIRACGATERPADSDALARHILEERTKWQRVIHSAELAQQ
jgi:tripartite-type tricarboxylate transporter receptor subunit TctC